MEYALEFVAALLIETFDCIKKPRVRRWAITGLMSALCMFLVGICPAGHLDVVKSENQAGTMAMGIFTAAMLVASIVIVLGHRRNWKHY